MDTPPQNVGSIQPSAFRARKLRIIMIGAGYDYIKLRSAYIGILILVQDIWHPVGSRHYNENDRLRARYLREEQRPWWHLVREQVPRVRNTAANIECMSSVNTWADNLLLDVPAMYPLTRINLHGNQIRSGASSTRQPQKSVDISTPWLISTTSGNSCISTTVPLLQSGQRNRRPGKSIWK